MTGKVLLFYIPKAPPRPMAIDVGMRGEKGDEGEEEEDEGSDDYDGFVGYRRHHSVTATLDSHDPDGVMMVEGS